VPLKRLGRDQEVLVNGYEVNPPLLGGEFCVFGMNWKCAGFCVSGVRGTICG
jgi:hypothetical protein